ncbi:tandem-95 repeat protein [Vibrio owensii]|uniref:tandem-95 repeat protein n=1 Tax=Vibrio owensii TaxID=696485 RepID=UPI0037481118
MDRTSLVSLGGQIVVIGLDGQLKTLAQNEQPLPGELIVARTEAEPEKLQVQVAREEGVQDVTDDVAQIIDALQDGQDPTLLNEEFAPAAGESNGSSLQASGTVERTAAELLADTVFETTGLAALGFSETQSLTLAELYLNLPNTSPAVTPIAPVAEDDNIQTDEDVSITIDVLANDDDEDSDSLTIDSATVPEEQGTVAIVDGELVFTPAEDFNGEATITYVVTDGELTDEATVSVTVNPVNDAPVANNDSTATNEDTPVTIDVLPNDTDVDGDTLTIVNASVPAEQGTVEIVDGKLVFTPAEDFNGEATISYTVSDGALEDEAEVSVTVNPANDAPIARDDSTTTDEDTPVTIDVLPNDSDVDGDTLTIVNASVPAEQGTVEIVDGKLVFTPAENFNGDATISYTVSDGALEDEAEVSVTVNPLNDAPTTENTIPSQVLQEDFAEYTINLNDAFSDVDNLDSELTFSVSGNSNIQVSIVDGIATITPTADWNGSEELTFTATDPSGLEVSQTVDFTVNAVADIVADRADIVEDTPTILDVLDNDSFEGQSPVVSVEAGNGPTNGSVVVNSDGTITYTPDQDYNGSDEFTYTVTSGGVTETTTVTLNVTPVNDKPVVENTIADQVLPEDFTPYTIDLNDAFSDVDNADSELTFSVSGNSNIQVSIVDGIATITPTADWNGSEELTFTATDLSGLEVSQKVDFTVNAVADIVSDSANIVEDTPTILDVLDNDNFEGQSPVVTVESGDGPENGSVVVNDDGTITYTPDQDYNGADEFTYTVMSGGVTETTTVTLNVTPVNDKPVVENTIADQVLPEDFTPYTIDLNDAFSDVDNSDNELIFTVSGNSNIQVSIVDGIATITPTADWNGSEELTFTATDPSGLEVSQTVDFTVNAVADIVADSADIVEDTPTVLDVLGNDTFEGQSPVVSVGAGNGPANGSVVVNNDGTITYTPDQDYNGADGFTYTVTSGGVTETTTVTLNVTPVNDKPVVENTIADQVLPEDFAEYTINLNDAFSDVDNLDSELTFSVSGNSNIQVSIVDGIATITPTADWNGSEELTFTATDPSGLEVSQTVDFTVNAVADIVADRADIVEDTPTVLNVLGNDTFEGQSPVVSVEAGNGPTNGSVVVNSDGTITYTPDQDYNGSDEFTYTVTSGGVTETTTVTLNVTPVNDKPVVENTIADQVLPEDFAEYTINLNNAFSDVDDADSELTFSVSGNSNIQVSIVDGIAAITPTADWNGSEELTFTATDSDGESVSQTVDFTVNAVADIVSDSANIVEDTPTILDVLDNDSFEGQSPVVTVESGDGPINGSVVVNDDGTITYTPDQDYNGADEFTYTVTSGGVTETTTVTLSVTPVNDKPVVENTIADQVLPEDFAQYTINLNDAFSDVDDTDRELTFSVSGNSNIQVSIVDGIATITPTADWNGSEELTFTATDPSGLEVSQTVDFTVNAVADIVADSADIVEDTPTILNVLGNDTFEGQSPVVSVESGDGPTNGNVVVNSDGTITYTPDQDYNGADEFTYTVTSGGVTETTTVTLNVTPVNDKPVVENTIADQVLPEDFAEYTINLNDAFSDVDDADSELTFSVSGNSNIQVSIVDGIATISPTADWNGSEELTFTATDLSGLEVSQKVDFTVNSVADIVSDSADIVEDKPTILDVLDNDSFEGQSPVVSVESGDGPTNGSVVVNNDGTITYTPNQDYNGADEFTYTVTSGGVTETTTVTLNVTPVNDKPVVENTIADQVLPEDFAEYTIDLNDAFSDVDNADSELTFSISGNSNIQVSIVDGIATITPTADWNGSEELTFTATDPSGLEVSQTVDFTVNAVADIVADSADIVEDTPTVLDVLDNDSFEGQSPVVSVEAGNGPANGSVVVNNDGTITYTPDQDYNGADEFTYTVTSGGVTETTTVTLNVTPVNDKPVVENTIADQVLPEDFTAYTINLNDAFSDVDDADSELTFTVSGNSNIQVSIVDGIATITPTADWNGSEELTFTATDPSGLEVSQTVDFTVNAVADIVADSADIVEDTPTILDVLDNDSFEGQSPVVSVEAGNGPANGSVVVNNDGTITYTPNQDYNGADEFTYTVTSGGVTETTTVTLNVTPVNDKPVVENTIADQVLSEDFTPYTIDLNDAFSDVDNADSELTFTVSGNNNIQVSIVNGIATITPTADWNGSEELTFTATDPSGLEVSQTVDFTVNAVADIVSDSANIVEDTPTVLNVLDNDSFEGQSPVVTVESGDGPTNGSVVVNNDGTITYTPNQDYNGADEFTYTVTSGGVTETTTVTLNVTPVNDKPLNEDFDHSADELITNVIFDTDDKPLDQGSESDHISDVEDDLNGDDLQIRITELPTSGTLYFKDENGDLQEITSADGSLYNKDSIYYEADNVGFLLGIKDRPNSPNGEESTTDFYNWGLSADGGESHSRTEYLVNGASIDISSDSGVLAQYNREVSHIGHGIADNDGQGIQRGETISIDLSENPVGSVNLGLDGLGGLFEHGDNNAALITVTYLDANGTEQTQVIEFLKPEGNNMLFQETSIGFGKDYPLPEGAVITQLDFSTKTSGNWELRYVEGFPPEDSFDYVVVDSGNAESDPATVTIANQVLDGNVSENGPDLSLTGNTVTEGEDVTFSVVLDEATETAVKYPITTLAPGSSADDSDVNLSNATYTNGVVFAGGYLIVPAGVSSFEIIVPTIDDLVVENDETMKVEIGSESGSSTILDNDSTSLSVSNAGDVSEGSDAVFTVSLSNEVQSPVVVNLSPKTDGNYTAEDEDLGNMAVTYIDGEGQKQTLDVSPSGDVTIPAGVTDITVTITTKQDDVYEGAESFGLVVTESDGITSNGVASGEAVIKDDGSAVGPTTPDNDKPLLSISGGGDINEGEEAIFVVSLSNQTESPVVINLATSTSGAYTAENSDIKDFVVTYKDSEGETKSLTVSDNGDVTIPAGITAIEVSVPTTQDEVYEGSESFGLIATESAGITSNGSAVGQANIKDDGSVVGPTTPDNDKPTLTVDGGGNVNEGENAVFTVSLSNQTESAVVVNLSVETDGNYSAEDNDLGDLVVTYVDTNGQTQSLNVDGNGDVTIPAGIQDITVTVPTNEDHLYEGNETFGLTVTESNGVTTNGQATGQATILDAESAPKVSIVADQDSVNEGQTAGFTVSLDQIADEKVTVEFEYSGTAQDGTDFTGVASIEVPAGQSSVDLDITTLTDGTYEGAESFTVTIKDVEGADATASTNNSASVTINDVQQAPKVSIVADADSTAEGSDANFTVSIDQKADEDVVVTFTIGGDVDSDDYTAPNTYTVTIPAGQTSVDLDIETLDDGIYEGAEDLTVTLTETSGADSSLNTASKEASVSVTDAQTAPKVSIVADTGSTAEGGDANFTVSIDQKADEDVLVTFTIGGDVDSDDYTAPNTYTVTIPAGQTSVDLDIETLDDGIYEGAEDLTVTLTGTSGADSSLNTASKEASISVTDEQAAPKVSIVADQDSVNEGQTAGFTVSLDQVADEKVTVEFEYSGVAQDGTDFTGVASIEVPAGQSSVDLDITTLTDGTYEGAESFTVTIKDVEGADATASTNNSASVTINDAQQAPKVSIVADTGSIAEGGDANFTVSIDQKADEDVVVTFTIGGDVDGDDYTAPNTYTVTIPAGQTSVDLDIETLDDGIYEGAEDLTVTLTETSGADSSLNTASKEASVSVTDAQTAPKVSIVADQDSVNEGQTAGFTVSLDQIADEKVTVEFEYSGTAQDGTDFTGVASIEVPAGQSSVDLDITTLTDGTYEGAESFTVTIKDVEGADATASTNNSASVTINDAQQAPKVSIVADSGSTAEGSDANFTVSIDQKADEDVVVTFTIGGDVDSDDYTTPNTYTVTIPAGQTSVALDIETLDDGIYEGAEDLTVTLTETSGADSSLNMASKEASVSVTDEQTAPKVSIVANQDSVDEGQTAGFTVSLDQIADEKVTVEFEYSGTAQDGTDFTGVASIEVPAGQSSVDLDITTLTDGTYEGAESFTVTIKEVEGADATASTNNSASVTINDAQQAPKVSIVADTGSTAEGGDANFTVSIDQKADEDVVVTFTIGGDVDSDDYTAPNTYTVTIPAGQTSVDLDIETLDDGIYEGAEDLIVTLTQTSGADSSLNTASKEASVSVTDEQTAPKVSIVADTGSTAEGGDANFTVSIDQKADEDVVVTFTIGGDVDSDDYTAPNTYTVTIPAGQTSVDLDIETLDDGIYEGAEDLTVTLTGTSGADSSLNTASKEASVSVTDEQTAPKVSIVADQDSVNEGQTAGFTVSLDQIADEKVTVEFEYSGTAQDGTDFTGVASIEVPAGQSSVDLDITTLTDGTYEGAESFTVTIKDVKGADATASTNNSASVTINDAQQAPKVSIVADTGSTAEGGDANFTVSIDQKADEDVVVTFTIGGDVDSDDYTAPNTYTVTIPAGQTSVDLDIETLDDGIYEGAEDLIVTLTETSGADSSLNTASKEASVSIADAQHAPEFISDGDLPGDAANNDVYDFGTVNENSVSGTVVGTLVAEDLDNDELTYSFADGTTTNGLFDIDPSTGEVSLNKTIDDVDLGDYTLQVKVADGTGGVDTAEVNVSLVNVNDAPEASPSSVTTLEDSQVTLYWASFGVTDADSETSTLSVQITSLPSDGALEYKDEQGNWQAVQTDQVLSKSQFDADGVRFTPEVNESGDDSFTGNGVGNQEGSYAQIGFKPTDGEDTGQESVLTIDVTPDADAPNLVTVTPGLSLPQQDFNVTSWTNVIVGSDNGQGVAGQVLIDAIEALDLEDGSQSTTTNVQDTASGATAADEAVLVTALVYLEAGTSYDFTGRADDSLAIKIGGTLVDEARWGNGRGDIKGDAFVPTSSGFYPIEIYHHNQSGPGNFNVDVSINGQTPVDLSNSNLYVVSDSAALDAVDVRTSELKEVDGVQFYETYEFNEGLQDTAIPISEIRASLTDTDGSESLAVTLKGLPIGAVLSDGVNSITVATVNEALDVTGWSLDSLTVTPPAGSHDDFTIAVTATSTESSNGDTEDSHATINVVVHENLATNTTSDVGITNEDSSLQGNVLLNDTDGDNVLLVDHITVNNTDYAVGETVSLDSGSLVVNQDGSYKFEPVEHWSGDVPSITYTTNTGATETLDIEVVAVADAPKVTISVGELSKTDAVDSNHASVSTVTENTSAQNDVIASGLGLDSVYQKDNPPANVSLGDNNDTSDTNSLFVGTDYNDTFYGGGGDDVFVGGGQNDSFYGDDASTNTEHDGTDTVYLTGNFSDYEFTFKNNHGGDVPYWIFLDKRSIDSVNDNTGQEDRGDHLYEIERVVFADKVVELNPNGTYQVLQDRWIPVDVGVDLVDTDGSEMVGQTVLVDGLPDGVELHVNGQVVAQEVSGGYLIDTDAQGQASFEIKVPFDYDGSLDFPISVTATAIESSNDDSASTTESADLSARDFELESGSHGDDTISGSADHDLIVGDVQGLEIIAGQDYNIAFVLDTSGSMGSWVGNAKDEILDVFDELLDSVNQGVEPGTVNIMLSEFATGATKVIEVDLSSVTARTDFVEELNKIGNYGSGNTNYESGLQSAVDWFGSQPNVNGENITYFITDGQPNTYDKLDNIKRPEFSKVILDVGGDGQLVTLQDVVNDNNYSYGQTVSYKGNVLINSDGHIFSPLTGQKIGDIDRHNGKLNYDDEGGSSVQAQHMYQVLALLSSVEAIGLGSGVSESTLQQYDTDGVVESEIDVTKLAETILGQDVPLKQGADTIHGGDGDDILLGDLIEFGGNEQGISAIQSHVAQETGQDISTVDAEAIHDYVKDNIDEFNQNHQGDKADTLYGQQGDDILFGHGGNDILVGGSGDDILIGGSGEDTFKFVDDGSGIRDGEIDTVKDFTKGEDKIDISDLLHTDDTDSIDSLLANNEIGLEADGDNLILTISESDGSASQKVVIEGGSSQYSEFLSDGSLSSADGSAILNDLLKINNDMS